MKVVLDSNVLFAALVSQGLCREVFLVVSRFHVLVTSAVLLNELEDVISRKLGMTTSARRFLVQFKGRAQLVEPLEISPPVCRDADDDQVLGTALAAAADCIVTGDQDLLILKKHRGILIHSPREVIVRLEQGSDRI